MTGPQKHANQTLNLSMTGCLGQPKQCIIIREIPPIYHTFVYGLTAPRWIIE